MNEWDGKMSDWKESGKTVKNNIKNTHKHKWIKHEWENEHGRTKLFYEIKNSINSTKEGQKQDD